MAETHSHPVTPLSQALGRLPSGLYILTVCHPDGRATGMLASWVPQAGVDPPSLSFAIGTWRCVAAWVAASRRFTLNQLAVGSKTLMRHFGRGFDPDAPAFEGVGLRREQGAAGPVLADALAYLDAEV